MGNRWGGYGYGRHGYWKRSADADAAVYYTTAYGYPQYQQYYGLNRFNMYTTGYPSTYTNYQSTYPYASVYGARPFTTYNFNRYNPMYNTQQVTRVARETGTATSTETGTATSTETSVTTTTTMETVSVI